MPANVEVDAIGDSAHDAAAEHAFDSTTSGSPCKPTPASHALNAPIPCSAMLSVIYVSQIARTGTPLLDPERQEEERRQRARGPMLLFREPLNSTLGGRGE
jgi:hypothetical protein